MEQQMLKRKQNEHTEDGGQYEGKEMAEIIPREPQSVIFNGLDS